MKCVDIDLITLRVFPWSLSTHEEDMSTVGPDVHSHISTDFLTVSSYV